MLQFLFKLLFSTVGLIFRLAVVVLSLVFSSLGNAALAFFNADADDPNSDEDQNQHYVTKGFVVDEVGAQAAYQNGIMNAAEATYFNED